MSIYRSIVVLTGAGVSAESGLPTFRDANGLWEQHRIQDVATPEGFAANPELVHRFYNERRDSLLNQGIQPNKAHLALAKLEHDFAGEFLLVTQNIDNLHEQAGSQKLIHMHGELLKMRCTVTGYDYPIQTELTTRTVCQCCGVAGRLRPHIVWFGELPFSMNRIYRALARCDLFISVGTSGHVYPAAGFVQEANAAGADTVEINLEPSAVESEFSYHLYGKAGELLPEFVANLKGSKPFFGL